MQIFWSKVIFAAVAAATTLVFAKNLSNRMPLNELRLNTWSIAAMDPATGDVGVALATCLPNLYADAVASLVPGKGVAVTQARVIIENRNRVQAALIEGLSAEAVLQRVANSSIDPDLSQRQYGVVTLTNGQIRIAGFTGATNGNWAGIQSDVAQAVTVQGNILVSEAVVADALSAFLAESADGKNLLPDRLLRALEAGSAAGGDRRCNNESTQSTAATAFVLVARGDDEPYAIARLGDTFDGADNAPWLAISETSPLEGPNPLIELRRRYDIWRANERL